ncbi:hypothetical protein ACFV2Z_02565 [Streptomyces sp. NPDC059688]|uniref:Uncharacterized protein n=2 Tax=Streptomyces TaxID=1883 RepID=A0ABV1UMG0_9ACTN|nr:MULTISPECIES: hypothetical protein [unclassified Streptomyces]UXY35905.1 hypothetical protein N8I86_14840 [Streptomyces sp. HUAS 14-6]
MVTWLEMPLRSSGAQPSLRAKYDVGNAVVMLSETTAYVALADPKAANELLQHPDVQRLTANNLKTIQPGGPLSWEALERQAEALNHRGVGRGPVGLGDLISSLTRKARIHECSGCARRRRGLNRIPVWGWWRSQKLTPQPDGSP